MGGSGWSGRSAVIGRKLARAGGRNGGGRVPEPVGEGGVAGEVAGGDAVGGKLMGR